jgi:hypothetical protein
MENAQRFNAVIIDPDSSTRMRLKQATTSVAEFDKVYQSSSIVEAASRLNSGDQMDVCFLSAAIEQTQLDAFILQAKAHKNGEDSAYICVMKGNSQASTSIAGNVISGFDGMLFEPYSVDQLVELTRIAARVRKERSGAREQAAIAIIISDIVKQLNQIAFVKKQGVDPTNLMKKFRNTTETLKRLQPESFQLYFTHVVEAFVSVPAPQLALEIKTYHGPSSRIQKRQQEKILLEAERLAASE